MMSGSQAVINNIAECLRRCGMTAQLVFIGRILFADRSDPDRTATRRVAADTGCPHTARQSRKKFRLFQSRLFRYRLLAFVFWKIP
jgi:hypothetical protein